MTTPTNSSRNVDGEQFHRLHQLAVDALGDDLGLADGKFETLAAHHLDQNRELQFAASHHLERVGALGFLARVMETLVSSSLSRRSRRLRDVTYCPSRPAKGEVFTVNCIAIVGSSMAMCGSGDGFSTLVIVSPMVMPSTPATATMSPEFGLIDIDALQPVEGEQLGDLHLVERPVQLGD